MPSHSSQDPEENLPDWLKDLRKRQQQEGDIEPRETAPEQTPSGGEPSPEQKGEEEPEWLLEIRRRHQEEASTQPHRTPPGEGSEEDVPHEEEGREKTGPRLTDTPPAPEEAQEAEPPKEEERGEKEPTLPTGELPDWLQGAEPEEKGDQESLQNEGATSVPAFSQNDIEPLSPGEVPSWLEALRPGAETRKSRASEEEESTGPLAGLSGVLPAEPEIARFGYTPSRPSRLEISENQQRHASVLERLIATEGQSVVDQSQVRILPIRILRYVIGVLLVLATTLPLLVGGQAAPRPEMEAYPESARVYNAIEMLPADSPVLVVFEVETSLYGEVAAPASAVLSHLLQKQGRLVFLATDPTGPALVERLLTAELAAQPSVATGDYVNLGYLSGGIAALRQFSADPRAALPEIARTGEDPWTRQALENVDSLDDFALVVIMTSEAETGKAWIEQSGTTLSNGLLMVSSAQAAPVLLPYLQSHPATLNGLVAGFSGASYYERLRADVGLGTMYWNAYSYALGAALILILIGGLYGRTIQSGSDNQTSTGEEHSNADQQ